MRAITPVFSVLLIIVLSVAVVGFYWLFVTGTFNLLAWSGTSTVNESMTTISSCMKIEAVYGNQVSIRNCGKGVIALNSLSAYLDDVPLNIFSTNNMGKEDFTTYTKVCPNNHINITTYHLDFAGTANENCYLYADKGVNHFTDWTHLVDAKLVAQSGSDPFAGFYVVANDINDLSGIEQNGNTSISLRFYNSKVYLHENCPTCGGSTEVSNSVSVGTQYYVKIVKSGTSIWAGFYSDAARTNLLFNLSLTLHANYQFRYIYAANNWNAAPASQSNISIDNLILQGPSAIVINEDETGTISLSGLWNFNPGRHTLRVINPRVTAEIPVDAVLPDSCVMDLEFDEGQGRYVQDSSGNNNTGEFYWHYPGGFGGSDTSCYPPTDGCTYWDTGKFGYGLTYNNKSWISIPYSDSLNISGDITVEMWFRPSGNTSLVSGCELITKGGPPYTGYQLLLWDNGVFVWKPCPHGDCSHEIGYAPQGGFAAGTWHHILGLRAGNYTALYIDGILRNSRNDVSTDSIGGNGGIALGANYCSLNSTLDEVRIYNQGLTPDQAIILKSVSYD